MTETTTRPVEKHSERRSGPPRLLERNVRALVEHAALEEAAKPASDKIATAIWRFAGTMKFVYLHVVIFGFWALLDAGWIAGINNFDPDFTILGTAAAVEAIFLATFVLRAQIQMNDKADLRNHLDLQVSLLAEQETTHILRLVASMADRMGIQEACDPEIQELIRKLEPADVLDRIEIHTDKVEEEIRESK